MSVFWTVPRSEHLALASRSVNHPFIWLLKVSDQLACPALAINNIHPMCLKVLQQQRCLALRKIDKTGLQIIKFSRAGFNWPLLDNPVRMEKHLLFDFLLLPILIPAHLLHHVHHKVLAPCPHSWPPCTCWTPCGELAVSSSQLELSSCRL